MDDGDTLEYMDVHIIHTYSYRPWDVHKYHLDVTN